MDRRRMALDCLEIESCGGNVLDFLREQGAISPRGTWWRLQTEELGRPRDKIKDGKENPMGKRVVMTPEIRAEVERMIEAGTDKKLIEAYLADHGSKNPYAHLYMIKKNIAKKETKSELAGFVPVEVSGKKHDKTEDHIQEEQPKKRGVRIREADGTIGTWREEGDGMICIRIPAERITDQDRVIQLTKEEWMIIREEIPVVLDLFRKNREGWT